LASNFFSPKSLSHSSSAEVQHDNGGDDGGDTLVARKGTWERAEEMELSLEQNIKVQASSEIDKNASSTSLTIPDSAPKAKRTRVNPYMTL
jgi:hypothetical protein